MKGPSRPASPLPPSLSSQRPEYEDVWPGQRNLSWLASVSAQGYKEQALNLMIVCPCS